MKTCFKCGIEKPISDFYKHKQMADGHLNKCKVCAKSDVTCNRKTNIDYFREYDRGRGNRQDKEYVRNYRERYPKKYKAHCLVNNYLRDGRIGKSDCEVCRGTESVAHHDDYSKPLEVRWLCHAHHSQWHSENGEGLNGSLW